MTSSGHLWAIGYEDIGRAGEVRDIIIELGWGRHSFLHLTDVAVGVRHLDGSFTFDRGRFPAVTAILGFTALGFLVGLVVAAPLAGATAGVVLGIVAAVALKSVGIKKGFVQQVKGLIKPGTSALFILDREGDMTVILDAIRGLGGTVLKTNADEQRAKLIQSTLAAGPADTKR